MKKILIMTLLLISLLITGCGTAEKPEDIFQQALKESENLQSFQVDMKMEQKIKMSDMNQALPMNMTSKTKVQTDPEAMYQETDLMGQKVKVYYVNDEFYLKPSDEEKWMKAPQEVVDQINQLTQSQHSPNEQLSQLETFVDELNMEEKKNHYVFSITASGDKMKSYVLKQLRQNELPDQQITEKQLQNMTIHDVEISLEVDKETYYPQTYSMSMKTNSKQNGKTAKTETAIDAAYSQFNQIGEIKLPENVKNNAEKLKP
ncbi:hypothetical protein GWK91_09110 [Virgibacillus sp. MSP4-1]|uniref:DUF6612 family protein n=1 Tax=Virgibacillus sp. MSP4-1 TaxID=2700081 RepID=UPI0003A9FFCC|nr:DUF6612 family protein [Virgibacillus sp. MSP4-1]QHS23097.1 hypothetical protein GWK91_09110 [Virgibacillus sp. MSP4-1]